MKAKNTIGKIYVSQCLLGRSETFHRGFQTVIYRRNINTKIAARVIQL